MAAVTLTEVGRRAGVSLATASRVINGSHRIPAEAIAKKVRPPPKNPAMSPMPKPKPWPGQPPV